MVLTRADGFLGVMVDDLIGKGAEEPCKCDLRSTHIWRGVDPGHLCRPNVHFSFGIPDDPEER